MAPNVVTSPSPRLRRVLDRETPSIRGTNFSLNFANYKTKCEMSLQRRDSLRRETLVTMRVYYSHVMLKIVSSRFDTSINELLSPPYHFQGGAAVHFWHGRLTSNATLNQ